MEKEISKLLSNLIKHDRYVQFKTIEELMNIVKEPVDWTYSIWEQLIKALTHKNAFVRAQAAQILCALAATSDPEERVLEDFTKIWSITYDEETVASIQSLQSIWRIGLAGQVQRDLIVSHLARRFHTCINEKQPTTIRYEIIVSLKKLFDKTGDSMLLTIAKNLIDEEQDIIVKKKYKAALC